MMERWLALTIACAASGGCVQSDAIIAEGDNRPRWSYLRNASSFPVATYGIPNTAAQLSIECVPAEQAVHLVIVDTEIAKDRPVLVRVAQASLAAVERLDPPDGFTTSRVVVSLREPILEKFAAGAGPMMIVGEQDAFEFASGTVPKQMVGDCLQFRHR